MAQARRVWGGTALSSEELFAAPLHDNATDARPTLAAHEGAVASSPAHAAAAAAAARTLVARCVLAIAYAALVACGYLLYRVFGCGKEQLSCHPRTGPELWAEAMMLQVFVAVLYLSGPTWERHVHAPAAAACASAATVACSPRRPGEQHVQLLPPRGGDRAGASSRSPMTPPPAPPWRSSRCGALTRPVVAVALFFMALFSWGMLGELSALHFSFSAGGLQGPIVAVLVCTIAVGFIAALAVVFVTAWRAGEALVTALLCASIGAVYASAVLVLKLDAAPSDDMCVTVFHPHHWLLTWQVRLQNYVPRLQQPSPPHPPTHPSAGVAPAPPLPAGARG